MKKQSRDRGAAIPELPWAKFASKLENPKSCAQYGLSIPYRSKEAHDFPFDSDEIVTCALLRLFHTFGIAHMSTVHSGTGIIAAGDGGISAAALDLSVSTALEARFYSFSYALPNEFVLRLGWSESVSLRGGATNHH